MPKQVIHKCKSKPNLTRHTLYNALQLVDSILFSLSTPSRIKYVEHIKANSSLELDLGIDLHQSGVNIVQRLRTHFGMKFLVCEIEDCYFVYDIYELVLTGIDNRCNYTSELL